MKRSTANKLVKFLHGAIITAWVLGTIGGLAFLGWFFSKLRFLV